MPAKRATATTRKKKPASSVKRYTYYRPYRANNIYFGGRGAYYVKGSMSGKAKLPGVGRAEASLSGAYTSEPTLSGLGAYDISKIRRNIFLHADPPEVRNSRFKEGAVIIRHREYIGDIVSASAANTFNIQSFPLNPAQSSTFPWLSVIAQQFEEYMINGMVFEFKSTASDAIASSTNLALGNVILATSYDPLNPPFSSQMEMLNYEYAQSCKVSESVMHMIECDPRQSPLTHLYTRPGTAPGNSDLRLYDFGAFYIATSGLQGTSINVGQLWVTYEFCFYKAKVSDSGQDGSMFKTSIPMANKWLGNFTAQTLNAENSFDVTLFTQTGGSTASSLTLPLSSGYSTYLISLNYNSLPSGVFTAPSFGVTNGYLMKQFNNNAAYLDFAPVTGSTTTSLIMNFIITTNSTSSPCVLDIGSLSNGAIPGSGATGQLDVIVTEIAYLDPNVYSHL